MKKSLSLIIAITCVASAFSSFGQSWNQVGNTAISSNFLGTTNNIPLRIRTNNVQRMIIDSLGRVGVGIAFPRQLFTVQSSGSVPASNWITSGSPVFAGYGEGTPGNADLNLLMASGTAANARGVFGMKRSRGTLAAPASVLNNDQLGSVLVSGFDGTNFQGAAAVDFLTDGTPTAGNVPVRISLVTGTNGGNRTERMRIGSNGDVNITAGNFIAARKAVIKGITGINGDTLSGTALYVNANATTDGIRVKDPINNFVLYADKSGENNGIYVSSSSTISGSGAIAGVGASTATGVEAYSSLNSGLYAQSDSGAAVYALSNTSLGLYAETGDPASYAGYFNGEVVSTGTFTSSDARLKNNIQPVENAMQTIAALQPRHYDFKREGNYAALHLPAGNHYGLIAQDVEKILPGLVKETNVYIKNKQAKPGTNKAFDKGTLVSYKAVNYTELIPIMLKGMQEIAAQNEALKAKADKVDDLQKQIDDLKAIITSSNAKQQSIVLTNASLEQNVPNPPANGFTRINYSLPRTATKASIVVRDQAGKVLQQVPITAAGKGTVSVNTNGLSGGSYTYSLYSDGRLIETKTMLVE